MQLSSIEYNATMQAINNAKAAIADDEFIDPYGEIPDDGHTYTNETLLAALNSVEDKLINECLPQ